MLTFIQDLICYFSVVFCEYYILSLTYTYNTTQMPKQLHVDDEQSVGFQSRKRFRNCQSAKCVNQSVQAESAKTGRLFRLAGHLGRTEKRGRGRAWRWHGGQWDGRVNVNHKLASRTANAGRGEMRNGSGGDSRHILVKE